MALWILALPLSMGVKAIGYQLKINSLIRYELGKEDHKDQICFSGAAEKIKLKKEAERQKKHPSEKLSFFGFYFFEKFSVKAILPATAHCLPKIYLNHPQGQIQKGFASLPYSPPNS